jgi:hypothetical protein
VAKLVMHMHTHVQPFVRPSDTQVVYSPHVYGPSLRSSEIAARGDLAYLSGPVDELPARLRRTWLDHWAFVAVSMGLCVVVGEWGGTGVDDDLVFQQTLCVLVERARAIARSLRLSRDAHAHGGQ